MGLKETGGLIEQEAIFLSAQGIQNITLASNYFGIGK